MLEGQAARYFKVDVTSKGDIGWTIPSDQSLTEGTTKKKLTPPCAVVGLAGGLAKELEVKDGHNFTK